MNGQIPPEIENFTDITLIELNNNDLTGPIPQTIGNLTDLEYFSATRNMLSGSIPSDIGGVSSLKYLYLSDNQLTGVIPPEIGNLPLFRDLYLDKNQLSGSIPATIGNPSNLTEINLSSNQLTDAIPQEIGNLSNLRFLNLSDNLLTGLIPGSLGLLTSLESMILFDNQLTGCYDSALATLCSQLALMFNNNGFISDGNMLDANWDDFCASGAGDCTPAPCVLRDYEALRALYLSTGGDSWINKTGWPNAIDFTANPTAPSGTDLSTWYGVTVDAGGCVTSLDLSNNNLVGTMPPEIGQLSDLTGLYLNDNQLAGDMLPELAMLSNLQFINLTNNQLSGCYDPALNTLCSQLDAGSNTNAQVSDGNMLLANWEDFCVSGTGDCSTVPPPACVQNDYIALRALYLSTGGDSWTNNTGWPDVTAFLANPLAPPGTDFSTWYGIDVNAGACVEKIILNDNNLSGFLSQDLGTLNDLSELDLSENQLISNIPAEIGQLSNLTNLDLSDNQFSGSIPPELGNLVNLMTLRLDTNQLSDVIPPELANLSLLQILELQSNQLSGCYDGALASLCNQLSPLFSINAFISDGNMLDADWEDFCTSGTGGCSGFCPPELFINDIPIANGFYQAEQTIYSAGEVASGGDVAYQAGNMIALESGFTVHPQAEFSAEIAGCVPSVRLCAYELTTTIPIGVIPDDLSGLTYNASTNTLFMIENGNETVYETDLSGNVLRVIDLIGFDDTEDIVYTGGTRYAVVEERRGRIVFFDIFANTNSVNYNNAGYVQLPSALGPWGNNQGLEGVTYYPLAGRVLTVKEKNPKGFYSFIIPSSFPTTLSTADTDIVCDLALNPFGFSDVAAVHHMGLSGATDPTTGTHSLLLSQESKALVEVDANCNEISRLSFSYINQPEGITMDNNGTIYIVAEPNELYIFNRTSTCP